MGVTCPGWCSRQLYAFIFVVLTALFLVIAVASPWYSIIATDTPLPNNPQNNTITILFWWSGASVELQTQKQDTHTTAMSWDDFQSDQPQTVYISALSLAILSLVAVILLALFFLFGLVIERTRRRFEERIFCGRTKWVASGLSLLCVVLIIISWAIFISFSSALEEAHYCPSDLLGSFASDDLWCSSFIGSKTYVINLVFFKISTTIVWLPYLGWICAVVATFPAIIAFVLSLLVRRYGDYERVLSSGRSSYYYS